MRIGVVSDTHMSRMEPAYEAALAERFAGVDMILHAGDLTGLAVLDGLVAPQVHAVCGNMDDYLVATSLPPKRTITVEGYRIGLIHGWGAPNGLEKRVLAEFEDVDCVVYGHSHRPYNHQHKGVLLFNPGTAQPGYRGGATLGILSVDNGLKGEIISL